MNAADGIHYVAILPPPQLAYTSDNSWTALSIGQQNGSNLADFHLHLNESLSKYIQPAQAEDGRGPASIYTESLGDTLGPATF